MNQQAACEFCHRPVEQWIDIRRFSTRACGPCTRRLAELLLTDWEPLAQIWPVLAQKDDEDEEPEPRVQLADGRTVEMRTRTQELKEELPADKRAELAGTLLELGMTREALIEAAQALVRSPGPEGSTLAVDVILNERLAAPHAMSWLRNVLMPT